MPRTIGNPLSWSARFLGRSGARLVELTDHVRSERAEAPPVVNQIGLTDLSYALRKGVADFAAMRTDVIFLCLIYPMIGVAMISLALQTAFLPYLVPVATGFALVGPVASVGLFEMSRRREMGQGGGWGDALAVLRAPTIGAIAVLAVYLVALFVAWIVCAHVIYQLTFGAVEYQSATAFFRDVIGTPEGWAMIALGVPVGAAFALVALGISVVSFQLLLDRDVGVPVAVATSLRVMRANPATTLAWGLIVAVLLFLGSLPFFLGLIVVLPILGHASWHLYRRAIG